MPPVENTIENNEQQEKSNQLNLNIELENEKLSALGARVRNEIQKYLAYTETRRGNLTQWRRDFELFPTGRSTRWRNSSDVPAPLTHIYCQNHGTRLNQQIIRTVPPFAVIAKKPEAMEYAPQIEEALVARLKEADWEEIADQVHIELPIAGNVFLRTAFEQEYVRSPRMQIDLDETEFARLVATGSDPAIAIHDAVKMDADGNPEMFLGWENVCVHSGVKFRVIPWEDGIILPALIRDPEECFGIGERLMIRGSDLKKGVKEGKYIKEAVEELFQFGPQEQPLDRYEKLDVQGIMPTGGTYGTAGGQDPAYEDYLCYELCWKMDANDDDELEWVIVTLAYHSRLIIRLQYLPYEHGRPYYDLFRYFTRPRELFGMGIAEKLASFQDAATAVLNQLIDHHDLVLNALGNFWYDGTSGFDPDKFELRLGRPLRVDSVEGIKPFELQPLPAEAYNVYQLFKDIADLVTASSNPSLGKATDTQKTLGEVQIVAAASSMQFEEVAFRVARDWARVWDKVRWLEAQYADSGTVQFRKTASGSGPEFGEIPREILLSDVDLVPAGLKQLADMQSRVQQATIVQNTLLQHPLTGTNMGILATALDVFLQSVNYPQREKIMAEIHKALNAQRALQEMEMEQEMQGGMQPGMGAQGPVGASPTMSEGSTGPPLPGGLEAQGAV